jgi:hypothetical protein
MVRHHSNAGYGTKNFIDTRSIRRSVVRRLSRTQGTRQSMGRRSINGAGHERRGNVDGTLRSSTRGSEVAEAVLMGDDDDLVAEDEAKSTNRHLNGVDNSDIRNADEETDGIVEWDLSALASDLQLATSNYVYDESRDVEVMELFDAILYLRRKVLFRLVSCRLPSLSLLLLLRLFTITTTTTIIIIIMSILT